MMTSSEGRCSTVGAGARCLCRACRPQSPRVPCPCTVHLELRREAQPDSDQHDQSQNPDALQGLVNPDRPRGRQLLPVSGEGDEPAGGHDRATDALDDLHHLAGDTLVAHRATLAKTATGRQSIEPLRYPTGWPRESSGRCRKTSAASMIMTTSRPRRTSQGWCQRPGCSVSNAEIHAPIASTGVVVASGMDVW